MMKKIHLIIALLALNGLYAQSGQVEYGVKRDSILYQIPEKHKERFYGMTKYANNQTFKLEFNKTKSSFKYINKLNSDPTFSEVENRIARSAFTSSFDFYCDILTNTQITKGSDNILIENKNSKLDWIISSDSKKIDNYLCYKATCRESYFSRNTNDIAYYTIEAWFAPMLPYGFGPIQFNGLPGLILELHYINTTYFATKILLSDKDIPINLPKGKTISKEEYNKKLEASMGGVIIDKKKSKN